MFASWTAVLALTQAVPVYEDDLPAKHPAIRYWHATLQDPVSLLVKRIDDGTAKLDFHGEELSYLPSLLEHLNVSIDSQTLVFSKTSLQKEGISPRSPRAIYFNDEVAVGFVPGEKMIELASVDPRLGVVFYTLQARRTDRARFARPNVCLECHHGPATLGVPGIYVGSVYPTLSGRPDFRRGSTVSDHRTAFEDRWGGWYVSGAPGGLRHRGNAVTSSPSEKSLFGAEQTLSPTSLMTKLEGSAYLSAESDIVALMTLEHQTQMTNLFIRLSWEARLTDNAAELTARIDEVVRYMLFADETPLRESLRGVSSFSESFPQRGPRDRRGRSLRDFDLETRLFRYPLSYLVYSDAFDALPGWVRTLIYERLYRVVGGEFRDETFPHLTEEDRRAIREILIDTKSNLPALWHSTVANQAASHPIVVTK